VHIYHFMTGVVVENNVHIQKFQGRLTWLTKYSICTAVLG